MKRFFLGVAMMIVLTPLAVGLYSSRADIGFGATVVPHEAAILFCYSHFNATDLAALGNLLNAESSVPPSLDDGAKFAARIAEICEIDQLTEGCVTPAGKMMACISAIVVD